MKTWLTLCPYSLWWGQLEGDDDILVVMVHLCVMAHRCFVPHRVLSLSLTQSKSKPPKSWGMGKAFYHVNGGNWG